MGSVTTAFGAMWIKTPPSQKAVLSKTNGWSLLRLGPSRGGWSVIASAMPDTVTPAGRFSSDESSEDSRPFTTTACMANRVLKRNGSRSAVVTLGPPVTRRKLVAAIAATFVNFHSSSRVVGKPRAMNRAKAEDRAVRSHSGPKAGDSRNASKSAA